jgi:nicotinate-nucleotide adenylyltransferase
MCVYYITLMSKVFFMKKSPLVLIGGSFDPVHLGHLWMADAVSRQLPNACIKFLPTAGSPLKHTQTSAKHRLAMLRLALRDTPYQIDRHEINQIQPVYTVDTLQQIRHQLGADRVLIFVIGQDSLESLHRWKHYSQLFALTHFWVFARHGSEQSLHVPAEFRSYHTDHLAALTSQPAGLIYLDHRQPPNISSTKIRQHLATSRPLVPRRIWEYNQRALLYGSTSSYEY